MTANLPRIIILTIASVLLIVVACAVSPVPLDYKPTRSRDDPACVKLSQIETKWFREEQLMKQSCPIFATDAPWFMWDCDYTAASVAVTRGNPNPASKKICAPAEVTAKSFCNEDLCGNKPLCDDDCNCRVTTERCYKGGLF